MKSYFDDPYYTITPLDNNWRRSGSHEAAHQLPSRGGGRPIFERARHMETVKFVIPKLGGSAGGFSLRALMIFAGRKSANIPDDARSPASGDAVRGNSKLGSAPHPARCSSSSSSASSSAFTSSSTTFLDRGLAIEESALGMQASSRSATRRLARVTGVNRCLSDSS